MTAPVINLKGICDALALRFVAATIGTPSGASAMRGATGQTPKAITAFPYTFIEVQSGSIVANQRWEHHIALDSVTVFSKRTGTTQRPEADRQRWLPYLIHATVDQMKLGLGAQAGYEVKSAFPTGWEWDEIEVAGEELYGIRVHWDIWVYETVSLTP